MKNEKINAYIKWAKKQGLCGQCQYPWHDGICECGGCSEHHEKMEEIARLGYIEEQNDWDIKRAELAEYDKKRLEEARKRYADPEWRKTLEVAVAAGMLHRFEIEATERLLEVEKLQEQLDATQIDPDLVIETCNHFSLPCCICGKENCSHLTAYDKKDILRN